MGRAITTEDAIDYLEDAQGMANKYLALAEQIYDAFVDIETIDDFEDVAFEVQKILKTTYADLPQMHFAGVLDAVGILMNVDRLDVPHNMVNETSYLTEWRSPVGNILNGGFSYDDSDDMDYLQEVMGHMKDIPSEIDGILSA